MLGRVTQASGDQQRAELVTVQPSGMRLIVQPRPPDMSRKRVIEELPLGGVPVKPGDSAQTAGDGGPGAAAGFQAPGEALDIRSAHMEQANVMLLAPANELAQVQRVRLAGQAGVTGQEPSQGEPLGPGEHGLDGIDSCGRRRGGHGAPPGSG